MFLLLGLVKKSLTSGYEMSSSWSVPSQEYHNHLYLPKENTITNMSKCLRPERFSTLPSTSGADKSWLNWKRTFTSFLASEPTTTTITTSGENSAAAVSDPATDKLDILINHVSTDVYDYISECEDYDSAIQTLKSLYVVPKNEIFARHILKNRKTASRWITWQLIESASQGLSVQSSNCWGAYWWSG